MAVDSQSTKSKAGDFGLLHATQLFERLFNHECIVCHRVRGRSQERKMADLPARERPIQDLRPMSDVAMAISTDADTDAAYLHQLVTS